MLPIIAYVTGTALLIAGICLLTGCWAASGIETSARYGDLRPIARKKAARLGTVAGICFALGIALLFSL